MKQKTPSRLSRKQILDFYFLDNRAKLIDLAAFLDRIDRAAESDEDFRLTQFRQALTILSDGGDQRARRVLEALSDPTTEAIPCAAGMKGATGAWPGAKPVATKVSS